MAHLIETMAYANEVPWHGLGNNIDADSTIEDWQRQSGLDWTVSKRQVLFPNDRSAGFHSTRSFKDKFVLARDTDNAWFGAAANIKDAVFHEVLELTS